LRGEAGEVSVELGEWWTDFQQQHPQQVEVADNKQRRGGNRGRNRSRNRSEGK